MHALKIKQNGEINSVESFYSEVEFSWLARLFLARVDVASLVAHSG